jgi:butyryl-CoA dehydrogenase
MLSRTVKFVATRVSCGATNAAARRRGYMTLPFITDEHRIIKDTCSAFSQEHLVPIAGKIDAEHTFPEAEVKKLGELGMMGISVDAEYGGSGMDTISYVIAMEEISKGCASTGVIMSVNNSLYVHPSRLKFRAPVG